MSCIKKIISPILVVIILSFGMPQASAADTLDVKVFIESNSNGNDYITFEMNYDDAQWVVIRITTIDGKTVYIGEQRVGIDEELVYVIDSKATRYSEYVLYASVTLTNGSVRTNTAEPRHFKYYTYDEKMEIINEILDGKRAFEYGFEPLSIRVNELYTILKNDGAIREQMLLLLDGVEITPDVFVSKFDDALLSASLLSKKQSVVDYFLSDMAEEFGINSELDESGWYNNFQKSEQNIIKGDIASKSYKNKQEFLNEYRKIVFLTKLSKTHSSGIAAFMKSVNGQYLENDLIFSLSFDDYNKLSSEQKEYAMGKITGIFYNSLAALETAFESAVKDAAKYNPLSGGSSGGDRGSSKSGGGSSGINIYLPENQQQENTPETLNFDDLNGVEWANKEILEFARLGIVNGIGGNKFSPHDNVTREQFVSMVVRAFGITSDAEECDYIDAVPTQWYYKSIVDATYHGVINGYGDIFGVGENITRQDMAVVLHRLAVSMNVDLSPKSEKILADENMISEYAKESIWALYLAEYINGMGDNRYEPLLFATRAEAVKLIYSIWNKAV